MLAKRVEHRRVRIREQEHVGFLYLLEPSDRRPVESDSFVEDLIGESVCRNGEMLGQSWQVYEPEVDDLDTLVLDQAQYFPCGPLLHFSSLARLRSLLRSFFVRSAGLRAAQCCGLSAHWTSPECQPVAVGLRRQDDDRHDPPVAGQDSHRLVSAPLPLRERSVNLCSAWSRVRQRPGRI